MNPIVSSAPPPQQTLTVQSLPRPNTQGSLKRPYFYCLGSHQPLAPFPAETMSYQPLMALWLVHCAALAYEPQEHIIAALKTAGFDRVTFFENGRTQAFLAEHPGTASDAFCILAFRGTENDYQDILTDVAIVKRTLQYNGAGYRVHGGFLSALQGILGSTLSAACRHDPAIEVMVQGTPGIRDALATRKRPASRLYITGHSLGGALATLAALLCAPLVGEQLQALYTFGCPRASGVCLAKQLRQQTPFAVYRLVNAADMVPRIPPALFLYKHLGDYLYLRRDGRLCSPGSFLTALGDVGLWQAGFFTGSFLIAQRLLQQACVLWFLWGSPPYITEVVSLLFTLLIFAGVFVALPRLLTLVPLAILQWWQPRALLDHASQRYWEKLDTLARNCLPGR